ncbi:MAG: 30S ribosomal protein S20 [Trueperella sp.]|nr:30S ribosomal protein S20 [Trueperella sp.]
MANIKSQIKRNKTNEKRRIRNKAYKTEVRSLIRKTREAAEAGNAEEANEALRVATRKIDKAVSKGVLHKNNAAKRKSRLAKLIASIED